MRSWVIALIVNGLKACAMKIIPKHSLLYMNANKELSNLDKVSMQNGCMGCIKMQPTYIPFCLASFCGEVPFNILYHVRNSIFVCVLLRLAII